MSTPTISQIEATLDMIERMPADSVLIQHDVTWDEYEELLTAMGEAKGLRISYGEGRLQIMTLSPKHEKYARLIDLLVGLLSVRLHTRVLFYGSSTIKKQREQKGAEPDGCFYVEKANLVGKKDQIDFNTDPPPDIVVEVDLHHESISKFPIYATLGVPEIWRYEGESLTIYQLRESEYVASESSQSLPLLTGAVLTDFLRRIPDEDQYEILLAFENWLRAQPQS